MTSPRSARLIIAVISGMSLPLSAAKAVDELPLGCFGRTYDAAHRSAHPGQTVMRIAVSVKRLKGAEPYVVSAQTSVRIQRHKAIVYAGGDCIRKEGFLHCPMDEDAGSFTLSPVGAGLKLAVTSDVRLHRLDQGSEESEGPFLGKSEDRTFLLTPAPAAACR